MKKSVILAMALATAALITACIPSVYPFYTTKDLRFDPRLVGQWRGTNGNDPQTWTFEKSGTNEYNLTVVEKENRTGKFSAHLFQLKNQFYLDLVPAECDYATNQAELVALSMLPGHLLVHMPQLGPELQLAFFNFEWLQKHLEANPKSIANDRQDKRFILTAPPRELQRFVLKHADELFDQPSTLVRVEPPTKE